MAATSYLQITYNKERRFCKAVGAAIPVLPALVSIFDRQQSGLHVVRSNGTIRREQRKTRGRVFKGLTLLMKIKRYSYLPLVPVALTLGLVGCKARGPQEADVSLPKAALRDTKLSTVSLNLPENFTAPPYPAQAAK